MIKLDYLEQGSISGKTGQLIILIHGLGADKNDLFGLIDYFAEYLPDAHFVSLEAPYPCDMAPYGKQWFSLQDRSEEKILAGLKNVTPALENFIKEKANSLKIPENKVALLGFSQGTMLSLYYSLFRENNIAAVLGFSGALISPEKLPDLIKSKPLICLIHGEDDQVVPFDAFNTALSTLQKTGVNVQGYSRQNLGHGIDPHGIKIGIEFLKQAFRIED